MECKYLDDPEAFGGERVLIETLWNVNLMTQVFRTVPLLVLIETLWNVNIPVQLCC